jgi:MFS family permease
MAKRGPIPPTVKRNTLFLAVSQALNASGWQLIPSLSGLIILRFTSSLALVGLTLGIGGLTGPLMSYPVGLMADAWGRRPILLLGLLLGGLGSLMIYFSVLIGSFWLFVLGIVLYWLALSVLAQTTVAAIDMYPPSMKGEGVSYVLSGTSVGSVGAPVLVWATTAYAASNNLDTLAVPWLAPPVLMLLSGLLVLSIRPDPLKIARSLGEYYPEEAIGVRGQSASGQEQVGLFTMLRYYPRSSAIVSISLAWGVMVMIMTLTSIILRRNGYGLTMISIAIAIHVFGMFGLSLVFGKLADRHGRKRMLFAGGIILALGGFATPLTSDYWAITVALFLVGVGWSALNVSTTAMMGDITPPTSMGRLMGFTQFIIGVVNLVITTAGGTIAQNLGFRAVGTTALILTIPIYILTHMLKEPSPGTYEHQ